MKILIARTGGISHAVCAIPMIKAIRMCQPASEIDILIGSKPEDFWARQVLANHTLVCNAGINKVYYDHTPSNVTYDVAIMAIPYDGRWANGSHFRAKKVLDARTEDDVYSLHEAEYQMDNARILGYEGDSPDYSFMDIHPEHWVKSRNRIYVGMSCSREKSGLGKNHWGNDNFIKLIKMILESDPEVEIRTSGDSTDIALSIGPVWQTVDNRRFQFTIGPMEDAFKTVASCGYYIGNGTGMMHVAASCSKRVVGLFVEEKTARSRYPLCREQVSLLRPTPEEAFQVISRFRSKK